jgi:putative ABC transport system ATP-binding protein
VAIARALLGEPALLLCDEPTGNLDRANTHSVLDLFDDLARQNVTLVVITHDEEVSHRAQRRVRIEDGRLWEETP